MIDFRYPAPRIRQSHTDKVSKVSPTKGTRHIMKRMVRNLANHSAADALDSGQRRVEQNRLR